MTSKIGRLSRRVGVFLITFMFAAQVLVFPSGGTEQAGSQETNSTFDPDTAMFDFRFENSLAKRVTAFKLKFTMLYENDTDAIFFRSYEYQTGVGDGLEQGEVFSDSFVVPDQAGGAPVDCSVAVAAVIYEDLSYAGQSRRVSELLLGREARQLVRAHWIERLQRVLDESTSLSATRVAVSLSIKTLNSPFHEVIGNHRATADIAEALALRQSISSDLRSLLTEGSAGLDGRLAQFIARLEDQYETVSGHVLYDVEGRKKY